MILNVGLANLLKHLADAHKPKASFRFSLLRNVCFCIVANASEAWFQFSLSISHRASI